MTSPANLHIAVAIAEAIRTAGSLPSGHLYAIVMGNGHLDLETYERILTALIHTRLVHRDANRLTWIGPVLN